MEDNLIQMLIEYVYVILVPLAIYAIKLLRTFLQEKTGVEIQAGFKDEVLDALAYGKKKSKKSLGEKAEKVEFDNETVQNAVEYLYKYTPKWIRMLGFTEEAVREIVESYLEE